MNVGEKIREYRKNAKLSQKALAEKLGVVQTVISEYETGKRKPKFESIEKIAYALHIAPHLLIQDDPEWIAFPTTAVFSGSTGEIIYNATEILEPYSRLNIAGQKKAVDYVEDLATMPKYQKGNEDVPDPEE